MSKQNCCVESCLSRRDKRNSLFAFPKDIIMRKIWVKILQINVNEVDVTKSFVCSRHFQKYDFKGTNKNKKTLQRLRAGAMPSLNLPTNIVHPIQDDESQIADSASKETVGISSTSDGVFATENSPEVNHELSSPEIVPKNKKQKRHVRKCIVPLCNNSELVSDVSMHKLPTNETKLRLWKSELNIERLTTGKHSRICDAHFNACDFSPNESNTRNIVKKNAVPTLNPKSTRTRRTLFRNVQVDENSQTDDDNQDVTEFTSDFVEPQFKEIGIQCNRDSETVGIETVDREVQCSSEAVDHGIQCNIKDDKRSFVGMLKTDEELSSWTNIPSFQVLRAIVKCVNIAVPTDLKNIDIHLEEVIVLVFIKLKLNLPFVNIATLFGKSRTTVTSYFYYLLPILRLALSPALYWPDSDEIRENMPKCFKKFPSTRVVLDCFETKMPTLKCLTCRILTYSHYKRGHTVKLLLGVTPAGQISYVSKPYCGRASDKLIFNHEKFLEIHQLDAYTDSIMVDKGFSIENECNNAGIKLIRPPFLRKPFKQLSKENAKLNVEIASARVHVERTIQRVRTFAILSDKLDFNILPWIEDISKIICCMVNMGNPILADERF